jgi:formylglycine-generating enzyme required for sulfatase activity/tRNA A-37 threonylcarbamoyl transferase component Bud32
LLPVPVVAGYEILGELGRGGMGVVYKARQISLNRIVALKMLLAGSHAGSQGMQRFLAEAQAVAALEHPNIIAIHEVNPEAHPPFCALEFIDGGNLHEKVAKSTMPPLEAARMTELLSRAMHYAHGKGIIHRDLKPANVLLTRDGQPKITDFGLAKRVEGDSGLTQSGAVMGTPSYMAPEQAEGHVHQVGPLSDVYALGATLYELSTGRPPFKAATPIDTLLQVITEEPVPPCKLQPGLPRDLETICLKCLAKKPERRYASAEALAEDLQRFQRGEPILARPLSRRERFGRWVKKHRTALIATSASVLLAGLLLALCLWYLAWQQEQRVQEMLGKARQAVEKASAATLEEEADHYFEEALLAFNAARSLVPEHKAAREGLIDLYLRRCRRAIDRKTFDVARGILLPLKELDQEGRHKEDIARWERLALGTSTYRLETVPPGAKLTLRRMVEESPGKSVVIHQGTTPVAAVDLAPGVYWLDLKHPKFMDIRCPLGVGRNETKTVQIALVTREQIPDGMVYVPAGDFLAGDTQRGTARTVFLPGYFIDRTEVTGAEYEKFLQATGWPPPERWRGSRTCPPAWKQQAVYNVTFFDALAYAHWAGKRLPTEWEWEKAARGVDGRLYPWGNQFEPHRCASQENPLMRYALLMGKGASFRVGACRDGASPYGCLDMAGNLWEWTLDRERRGDTDRVIRGGAFPCNADELITFHRKGAPMAAQDAGGLNLTGFRCVKPLQTENTPTSALDALTTGADLADAAAYYWDQDQLPLVQACTAKMLQLHPQSIPGHYWQAVLLHRQGQTAEALKALQLVYGRAPNFKPQGRRNPIDLARLLSSVEEKEAALVRNFRQFPRWLAEMRQAMERKSYGRAEELITQLRAVDADHPIALEELALIYEATSRPAEAAKLRERRLELYRMELKENPDDPEIKNSLADFLCQNKLRLEEARQLAEETVAQEPYMPRYRATLAEIYQQTGRTPEALQQIRRAMELDPEEPLYQDLLAEYQLAQKRGKRQK